MFGIFVGIQRKCGELHGWTGRITHAWGITLKTLDNQFKCYVNKGFNIEQKRGVTQAPLFLIQTKNKQFFTGLNQYKKRKYNKFREDPSYLDEITL